MNRRDLVQKVLLGTTALIVMPSALTSCEKDPATPDPAPGPAPGTKITIDLTLPENSALNNDGGTKIVQSIIVANTGNLTFVALSSICTHEGCTVAYSAGADNFQCACHGSVFAKSGSVVNGPAPTALKSYPISKAGDILTITA
jgi:cytochrome b6-f complex iron-sulfur subunit